MQRSRTWCVAGVAAVALGGGAWMAWDGTFRPEQPPVEALVEEGVVEEAEAEAPSGVFAADAVPSRPRTDWDLTVTRNDRVDFWIDFLQGRNRDRTRVWLEREGRYGEFIRTSLRERGMPEDLFYLAMIESGLSPGAYSRAHAAGIWQFIAETGRRYGLEVSTYVDERRDPIRSTEAALDYLTYLHNRFGSWYLAAAGYNSGENRVDRILRQQLGGQRGDDALYWRIARFLPQETRDYVPLMLAAGHIGKDPERYGFHGIAHQSPLSFERVAVPGGTALSAVAEAAGLAARELEDLNPHLVRRMTPPGRSWEVRVPVGQAEQVASALERIEREQRLAASYARSTPAAAGSTAGGQRVVTHRIRRGETLSHVARRYGVSVAAVQRANPGVNPRRLHVGQTVRVPVSGAAMASASPQWRTYQVRRGDTLSHIARRHGVTVRQIQQWNGIGGSRIYPGQRIRIAA